MLRWKPIVIGAAGGFALLSGLQAIGNGMVADSAKHQQAEEMAEGSEAAAPVLASHGVEDRGGGTERTSPAPINSAATMAYTADMFPGLVRKFGDMIPTIERERNAAARIAALYTRCDEVLNVQITSRSAGNNRRYYADCTNRTRIFFDTKSIAAGYPAGLQTREDMLANGLENW